MDIYIKNSAENRSCRGETFAIQDIKIAFKNFSKSFTPTGDHKQGRQRHEHIEGGCRRPDRIKVHKFRSY